MRGSAAPRHTHLPPTRTRSIALALNEGPRAVTCAWPSACNAGIMASKRTHELIPLCHPLMISKVEVEIEPDATLPGLVVRARVKTSGQTGVEMEAL
ncbi:MAG: hypothetical protein B7Y31_03675, partial [Novosphingobium sp. 16-62-11]